MRLFKAWLRHSTLTQRRAFVRKAGISLTYLRELIQGERGRQASAAVAGAMERAARDLKLPPIKREQLCPACRSCDLARIARKHGH